MVDRNLRVFQFDDEREKETEIDRKNKIERE